MGSQLTTLLEDVRDTAYDADDIHLIRATLFLIPHARQISDDERILSCLGDVLRHFQDIEEEKEARACVAAAAAGRAAAAARAFAAAAGAAARAGQETRGRVTATAGEDGLETRRGVTAAAAGEAGQETRRGVTAAAAGEDGLETRGRRPLHRGKVTTTATPTAAAAGDKENENEDEAADADEDVWYDAEEQPVVFGPEDKKEDRVLNYPWVGKRYLVWDGDRWLRCRISYWQRSVKKYRLNIDDGSNNLYHYWRPYKFFDKRNVRHFV